MKWTKNHNSRNFQKTKKIFTKQIKISKWETSCTTFYAKRVKVDKVIQPWNTIGEMQITSGFQNTSKRFPRIRGEVRKIQYWRISRFCKLKKIWSTRNYLKFLADRLCLDLLRVRRRSLFFLIRMINLVVMAQGCCHRLIELVRRVACFIMILKLLKTEYYVNHFILWPKLLFYWNRF